MWLENGHLLFEQKNQNLLSNVEYIITIKVSLEEDFKNNREVLFSHNFSRQRLLWHPRSSVIFFFADLILASLGCLAGTKLSRIQISLHWMATILALIAQTGSTSTLSRPGWSPGGLAMLCWIYNNYILKFQILRRRLKQILLTYMDTVTIQDGWIYNNTKYFRYLIYEALQDTVYIWLPPRWKYYCAVYCIYWTSSGVFHKKYLLNLFRISFCDLLNILKMIIMKYFEKLSDVNFFKFNKKKCKL